jgi:ABC-type nitrate/sulfonate/bicarbonate transport system permease component
MYRALPPVAVVPFLFLVFGVSEASRVLLVLLGVFFPVWVSAHEGAARVDSRYLEVATDLEFSRLQRTVKVIFPATLPYTIGGVRTGIAMAYIVLFIAEWVGANQGIGYRLSVAHVVSATDHMLVGLIFLGALSYGTDAIYRLAVRMLFPWAEEARG